VELNHIYTVLSHLDRFGLAVRYVSSVYERHDEPYMFEGKARAQIFRLLYRRGWIRVRYNQKDGLWHIEDKTGLRTTETLPMPGRCRTDGRPKAP
jgi:hypothetical protein